MNTSASRRYIHTATPLSPSEVRDISRKECFWLGKGPDGKFLIESDHQLRKILTLYTNQQLEIMYEALVDQQSADTSSPDTWNARIEVVETFMDSSWAGIDTS